MLRDHQAPSMRLNSFRCFACHFPCEGEIDKDILHHFQSWSVYGMKKQWESEWVERKNPPISEPCILHLDLFIEELKRHPLLHDAAFRERLTDFLSSNVSSSSPITNATLVSAHSTVMSPPRTTPNSTRPCVNNESQSKTRTFCGFRDLFSFSSVAGTSTKAYLDESKNGKRPARYPSFNLSWYCLSLS